MMNNSQVLKAFAAGRAGSSSNGAFSTDGKSLYSYRLRIATHMGAEIAVGDYTASGSYYSQTTSKHVGYARSLPSATVMVPELFEKIPQN
jgi:hypothetical protein